MKASRTNQPPRMDLVRGRLHLGGAAIGSDQSLRLRPLGDPARHVDGVVHERRVAIVSDPAPPAWMTGVNWHLHPQPDGSWRLVNQNEAQHCLTALPGRLELRPAIKGFAAGPSQWMIYRQPGRDVFCLRPVGGQWLCWRDGQIALGRRTGPDDDTVLWQFHRPPPAAAVKYPPESSPYPGPPTGLRSALRALGLRRW